MKNKKNNTLNKSDSKLYNHMRIKKISVNIHQYNYKALITVQDENKHGENKYFYLDNSDNSIDEYGMFEALLHCSSNNNPAVAIITTGYIDDEGIEYIGEILFFN
ncbi:hypothetical protein [Xenorhabdus innexi]|uniref:Uncharacterized protein n=1 Tax=Xenorhabdus innexi TaxID=290109 RepID=A0A1N6MYS1_9GAMM|nr:hypothetical protein [Xenorhabdus innexi]PHM31229.1 hypothetical protein Xinn_02938 [Xenorhabdus innexi]SIP74023.1 hypothetical protein XIS1_490020 [Xenorhabdus innexi]